MNRLAVCVLFGGIAYLSLAIASDTASLSDSAPGRLVFVSKESDKGQTIWRLNLVERGSNTPTVIAQSRDILMSPQWSPDGSQIVYIGYEKGKSSIFLKELATGKIRSVLRDLKGGGAPAWSPDGTQLAFSYGVDRNVDLYIMTISTGKMDRITEDVGIDTEPAWSSDGSRLVFTSDRAGTPQTYEVQVANPKQARALLPNLRQIFAPHYSPDGKMLLFVVKGDAGFCIELLDLQSGKRTRLGNGPFDESPSFSPDGQFVIYVAQQGTASSIEVVSLDGVSRHSLKSESWLREPSWSRKQ